MPLLSPHSHEALLIHVNNILHLLIFKVGDKLGAGLADYDLLPDNTSLPDEASLPEEASLADGA